MPEMPISARRKREEDIARPIAASSGPALARRTAAALLAAAFLLGGGASPTPGHTCPHHQPDERARVDATAPASPAPDAPYTCVGTCHGTAAAPLPSPGPEPPGIDGSLDRRSEPLRAGRPAALATVTIPPLPRSPPRI